MDGFDPLAAVPLFVEWTGLLFIRAHDWQLNQVVVDAEVFPDIHSFVIRGIECRRIRDGKLYLLINSKTATIIEVVSGQELEIKDLKEAADRSDGRVTVAMGSSDDVCSIMLPDSVATVPSS